MGASTGDLGKIAKFLHPQHLRVHKVQFSLSARRVLSVITAYDCPQFKLHSFSSKMMNCKSLPPPKFWGKKPKATTKVTLTRHQKVSYSALFGYRINSMFHAERLVSGLSSRINLTPNVQQRKYNHFP